MSFFESAEQQWEGYSSDEDGQGAGPAADTARSPAVSGGNKYDPENHVQSAEEQWDGWSSSSDDNGALNDGDVPPSDLLAPALPRHTAPASPRQPDLSGSPCFDLANGQPSNRELPVDVLRSASESLFSTAASSFLGCATGGGLADPASQTASFLNYGDEAGDSDFLEMLASFLNTSYSIDGSSKITPEQLCATGGVSQGVDMAAALALSNYRQRRGGSGAPPLASSGRSGEPYIPPLDADFQGPRHGGGGRGHGRRGCNCGGARSAL